MMCQRELGILVERLEAVLNQAEDMRLEHLQFLLSMALMEAKQQLCVVSAPLRIVVSDGSPG